MRATSAAVENMPAWPATPPSTRARGSWTSPTEHACRCGTPSARSRACWAAVGWNDVSLQPERPEEEPREVPIERLAGHAPHELAEQDEARVAVLERRCPAGSRAAPSRARPPRRGNPLATSWLFGIAGMPALWVSRRRTVTPSKALPAELLQIAAERRVELDGAALDEAPSPRASCQAAW